MLGVGREGGGKRHVMGRAATELHTYHLRAFGGQRLDGRAATELHSCRAPADTPRREEESGVQYWRSKR